jgi:7,8-dihydropterin-6-yl-methyl-4-(beta-D-ribofuranosyl)aminobenzene 5'-phosphate synthase
MLALRERGDSDYPRRRACVITRAGRRIARPRDAREESENMNPTDRQRRGLLKALPATLLPASLVSLARPAMAAAIQAPQVDRLSIRVLVDSSFDLFFRPTQVNGVKIERPPRIIDYRKTFHNEWGLSLWLDSLRGTEARSVMLDYGYTSAVLFNNMELTGVEPAKLNALVVSHGHYDHFGALLAFLDKFRDRLPRDVKLYAGGEDNFCRRVAGAPGQFTDFGVLDRRELAARKVNVVLAQDPVVIADHAFTTGRITRRSIEKVLPNTHVEFGVKDGVGCDSGLYLPTSKNGQTVPDEHIHEHATCFHVRDKGLVVISSCGHVGIVNSVRQAQEVSGIEKVHAIVGGFHLGPAPKDYLQQVVAEIKKLKPDVVIPMHCSGLNFVQEVNAQMPENLLVTTTGTQIYFGA